MDEKISQIGDQILNDLILAFYSEQAFYVSNRFGKYLNEEDALYITDDDIIKYIKSKLSSTFYLEVKEVDREFDSTVEEFLFRDTELKIQHVKNND